MSTTNRPQFEEEFIHHELVEWGDYVEERLKVALTDLNVGYTQELLTSLSHRVLASAANHRGRFEQLFKEYGRFVDMGTGRGGRVQTEKNKRRALRRNTSAQGRQAKKWYSKTFFGSLNKLIGNLSANYAAFAMQQLQVLNQQNNQNTI
jgi:hypothetical protein